jgi:hypothetical protein
MKTEANFPIWYLILNMIVFPVTMVNLLIAISMMKVKKQERNSAHVKDIP